MAEITQFKAEDIMSERVPHTGPDNTVSDAIGLMRKHDLEEIPVVEDDEVVGIISDDTFIEKRHLPLSTKLKHVMSKPPQVKKDDSIIDVSEMLLSSGYRGVPVTSKSKTYTGFISRKNITKIVPSIDELKKTEVKDFMTPSPATLQEHESIGKAKATMKRYDIRVLPVVDKYGKVSGVIGIQDILEEVARPEEREERGDRAGEKGHPSQEIEVQSMMSEPVITTTPNSQIHDAAEKMNESDISTLAVTEDDELKGVITQIDLVEMITSFREADQVYVQITGLEERTGLYDQMYDLIQNYLNKMNQVLKPLVFNVHVVSHQTEGEQSKYSIRLRLSTDYGMFYAKEFDWNIMSALDQALDSIKRRVFENKEKMLDRKKHPKYQEMLS